MYHTEEQALGYFVRLPRWKEFVKTIESIAEGTASKLKRFIIRDYSKNIFLPVQRS